MANLPDYPVVGSSSSGDYIPIVVNGEVKLIAVGNLVGTLGAQNANSVAITGGNISASVAWTPEVFTLESNLSVPLLTLFGYDAASGGQISFVGKDSLANVEEYAQVRGAELDDTAGSEDGQLWLLTKMAGTLRQALSLVGGLIKVAVTDTIATGATQAVELVRSVNFVTTANAGPDDFVTLPVAVAGYIVAVINTTGSTIKVASNSGSSDTVDGGASVNLTTGQVGIFFTRNNAEWYSLIN